MSGEERVAVVVDSGSSMRQNFAEVNEAGVTVIPLEVKFFENGQWIPYSDADLSAEDFYRKMAKATIFPQTSGAVIGRATNLYEKLGETNRQVISIHITARHSVAYESALLAARNVMEGNPEMQIEIIDSKTVSAGSWFLGKKAALLSKDGYPLGDIKRIVLEAVPKVEVVAMLPSLDNLIRGGRMGAMVGNFGNILQIKPLMGFVDGQITRLSQPRTVGKAVAELITRVERVNEEIVNLAVLHTNNPEGALSLKASLEKFYPRNIPIYEAGPVLGLHTGEGALGYGLLKK